MKNTLNHLSALLFTSLFLFGCVKKNDTPAGTFIIPSNTTIAQLKSLHRQSGFELIKDDIIIQGIIVANDKSGNFYKEIVVQDTTGGISIKLDNYNLFTLYPVGGCISIKCKGLYLSDYNRRIQLAGGVDLTNPNLPSATPIAALLFDAHLAIQSLNNTVHAKEIAPDRLTTQMMDSFQNTLITLQNVEFDRNELEKTYADSSLQEYAREFVLKNCSGIETIMLRTSSYANFASTKIAKGNGSITGVYTLFGTAKQLYIRDTNDVQLYNARCVPTVPNGNGIELSHSPVMIDFNGITNGLPQGVTVMDGAKSNNSGKAAIYTSANATWASTAAGYKNYASAKGQASSLTAANQNKIVDRALGVRQGTANDPGAAFVFEINSMSGKRNLKMNFLLQSLAISAKKTTSWSVDYAIGNSNTFIAVPVTGIKMTGNAMFSNSAVYADFGNALDNSNSIIRIRIVALTASTGSGSRPATAIDDVTFSWE